MKHPRRGTGSFVLSASYDTHNSNEKFAFSCVLFPINVVIKKSFTFFWETPSVDYNELDVIRLLRRAELSYLFARSNRSADERNGEPASSFWSIRPPGRYYATLLCAARIYCVLTDACKYCQRYERRTFGATATEQEGSEVFDNVECASPSLLPGAYLLGELVFKYRNYFHVIIFPRHNAERWAAAAKA